MSQTEQGLHAFVADGQVAQAAVDSLTPRDVCPLCYHHESHCNCERNTRPASLNPTRFLNRSEVHKFLLECAGQTRAHKFTRVSEETLVQINEAVRTACLGIVRRAPSKGKTL